MTNSGRNAWYSISVEIELHDWRNQNQSKNLRSTRDNMETNWKKKKEGNLVRWCLSIQINVLRPTYVLQWCESCKLYRERVKHISFLFFGVSHNPQQEEDRLEILIYRRVYLKVKRGFKSINSWSNCNKADGEIVKEQGRGLL